MGALRHTQVSTIHFFLSIDKLFPLREEQKAKPDILAYIFKLILILH